MSIALTDKNLSRVKKRLQRELSENHQLQIPLHAVEHLIARAFGCTNAHALQAHLATDEPLKHEGSTMDQPWLSLATYVQHYFEHHADTKILEFSFMYGTFSEDDCSYQFSAKKPDNSVAGWGLYFGQTQGTFSSEEWDLTQTDRIFLNTVYTKMGTDRALGKYYGARLQEHYGLKKRSTHKVIHYPNPDQYPNWYYSPLQYGHKHCWIVLSGDDLEGSYAFNGDYVIELKRPTNAPAFSSFTEAWSHRRDGHVIASFIYLDSTDHGYCDYFLYSQKNNWFAKTVNGEIECPVLSLKDLFVFMAHVDKHKKTTLLLSLCGNDHPYRQQIEAVYEAPVKETSDGRRFKHSSLDTSP